MFPPKLGREAERERADIQTQTILLVGKKIALYKTEIKWISAIAEWLGNSIHFNVLWAVIPIFIQRHSVSQKQLAKVFNIFCNFYMYFSPVKWYCCMLAGITQISWISLFSVSVYYLWGALAPTFAFRLTLAIIKYYCDLFWVLNTVFFCS